jgi:hypothetical protein
MKTICEKVHKRKKNLLAWFLKVNYIVSVVYNSELNGCGSVSEERGCGHRSKTGAGSQELPHYYELNQK